MPQTKTHIDHDPIPLTTNQYTSSEIAHVMTYLAKAHRAQTGQELPCKAVPIAAYDTQPGRV
jgi:hypothetical protein